MIRIHTILIGQPQTLTDEQGTWRSAIFRAPVSEPIELHQRGLAGDQVADTDNHGSPAQAVCCHPFAHYEYWNDVYGLADSDRALGPGSVGENWTLSGVLEKDVCIGDVFGVGTARVEVSGPRYPCTKQERKVKLLAFHRRTIESLRTGWYLRVLTPGMVQAGDPWTLHERRYPDLTVHRVNACGHQSFDPLFAQQALEVPELAPVWKYIFRLKLTKQWSAE